MSRLILPRLEDRRLAVGLFESGMGVSPMDSETGAIRGMGVSPMDSHERDARATRSVSDSRPLSRGKICGQLGM